MKHMIGNLKKKLKGYSLEVDDEKQVKENWETIRKYSTNLIFVLVVLDYCKFCLPWILKVEEIFLMKII